VFRIPYSNQSAPHTSALANLATEGLGERRAEGFGWLDVNPKWAKHQNFAQIETQQLAADTIAASALTAPINLFHKQIWRRYWQDQIGNQAMGKAAEIADLLKLEGNNPTTTQAANLLQKVLEFAEWTDYAQLAEFAKSVRKSGRTWNEKTLDFLILLGTAGTAQTQLAKLIAGVPANDELRLHGPTLRTYCRDS
jgi:hypothetical protein